MGFFSKLKKKVKSTYKKADVALGGRLPGGVTPAEVKAKQSLVRKPEPLKGTVFDPKRALGKDIPTKVQPKPSAVSKAVSTAKKIIKSQSKEAKTPAGFLPGATAGEKISAGLSVIPGGGTVGARVATKGFTAATRVAGTASVKIGSFAKQIGQRSIDKIASTTGKSALNVGKAAAKADKAGGAAKVVKKLTPKKIWKALKFIGAGILGIDGLMVWYSLDNVIGGTKFFTKDLANAAEDGSLNPLDAKKSLEVSIEARETAKNVVEISAKFNPLLWPFRNLVLAGMDADDEAIQFQVDRINAAAAKFEADGGVAETPETFDEGVDRRAVEKRDRELQFREEDKLYYDQMAEARRAQEVEASREEREETAEFWDKIALEKREREMQWRKEDQLYYEKLAKQRKKNQDEFKKSQLTFGLLK